MSLTSRIQSIRFDLFWLKERPKSPYITWIGLICTLIAIYIIFQYMPYIANKVKNRPEFQINQAQLTIHNLPNWITPYTTEIIPAEFHSASIFTPQLAKTIASCYARNPWVKDVQEVAIRYPNYVSVRLILRRPYALVESQDKWVLCDTQGISLPFQWELNEDIPPFPTIHNLDTDLPIPGRSWEKKELIQTLELLQFLERRPELEIHTVWLLATPTETEKSIILITKKRCWIIWGTSLRSTIPNISEQQRLSALDTYFNQYDDNHPIQELDVRFGYPIVREKNQLFPQLSKYFSRK